MITQEQYNALNAKIDMYIRCQNSMEKEFRELEREVYNLKQQPSILPVRVWDTQKIADEGAGVAWLR